jgi:predicted methyltransferase
VRCKICHKKDGRLKKRNVHKKCVENRLSALLKSRKGMMKIAKAMASPLRHTFDYAGIARDFVVKSRAKQTLLEREE